MKSDLANWVLANRMKLNLTQSQLADMLSISVVQLSKIENDRSETKLSTVRKMCEIFNETFLIEQDRQYENN